MVERTLLDFSAFWGNSLVVRTLLDISAFQVKASRLISSAQTGAHSVTAMMLSGDAP